MGFTHNTNPTSTGLASETTPTKQAWTPGPWDRYNDGPSSNIFLESTRGAGSVCKIANNSHAEANAKLIAKGPEAIQCLANFLDMAASWHSVHGHTKDSVQCDAFCDLIPEATRILREAGAL